jgi:hypothetical protein
MFQGGVDWNQLFIDYLPSLDFGAHSLSSRLILSQYPDACIGDKGHACPTWESPYVC